MHKIEPFYKWRHYYIAANDEHSPFYGRIYSEFQYTNKVYNYYVHPQWEDIDSETLYLKVLYADYDQHFAIVELLGEWNDCIGSDIINLKRNIIDEMQTKGIHKFIFLAENLLNIHIDDDCYYEEWYEDVQEENGWVAILNLRQHIEEEMLAGSLQYYISFGEQLNDINWRKLRPQQLFDLIQKIVFRGTYLLA